MKKQYDPRMHTAEHILNQTIVRMFRIGRCFSSHIEKKKSKCDYRFDRALTGEETLNIEKNVNSVIKEDMPVTEEYLPKTKAETLFSLERLPEEAGEKIRIIRVGGYDACPCIGSHVKSTKEIGDFRITSTNFNNGTLRIRFNLSISGK